ncbi:hypothetical protein C8J56DRAFT_891659 [Mycena floridula]|nr:hypothetical protein C8J56DRAFT_891659 [Mycena floridula]
MRNSWSLFLKLLVCLILSLELTRALLRILLLASQPSVRPFHLRDLGGVLESSFETWQTPSLGESDGFRRPSASGKRKLYVSCTASREAELGAAQWKIEDPSVTEFEERASKPQIESDDTSESENSQDHPKKHKFIPALFDSIMNKIISSKSRLTPTENMENFTRVKRTRQRHVLGISSDPTRSAPIATKQVPLFPSTDAAARAGVNQQEICLASRFTSIVDVFSASGNEELLPVLGSYFLGCNRVPLCCARRTVSSTFRVQNVDSSRSPLPFGQPTYL